MRNFRKWIARITLLALMVSLCNFVPLRANAATQADVSISMPVSVVRGEIATATVRLQNTPDVQFVLAQVVLPEGLSLVSAKWLCDGAMNSFDMNTNYGVLAFETAGKLDTDVLEFVVKGEALGDDQTIQVNFTFRVGANEVGSATGAQTIDVVTPYLAGASISGLPGTLTIDETATITVKLQNTPDTQFAMAQVQLSDGLRLVSAQWLCDGVMKDFDMHTNIGVLAQESAKSLDGDALQLVVEGEKVSTSQEVRVDFQFKVGAGEVGAASVAGTTDVVVESLQTTASMDLPNTIYIDDTAVVTVSLQNAPITQFAMAQVQLSDGLSLVSAQWLCDGVMKDFDMHTNIGVLAMEPISKLDGKVLQLVIKGVNAGVDESVSVGFNFRVGATDVGSAAITETTDVIYYKVVFKNEDGSVISEKTYHWGDPIVVPANPTKAADNTYTYTFAGWDSQVATTCAGNATYTATYTSTFVEYPVIFKNEDGSVISEKTYHWGDPVVVPANPTKAADNTYTYTFAGWDSQVVTTCAGNATYTATYTSTFVEYPVIFKNEDGSVISEKTYHWGDPIVVPADPTKAADNTYTYAFAGWDSQVATTCAGNATYTATYTSTFVEYPVIFKNEDGSVISEKTYHWGDPIVVPANPTKAADNTYTYTFAGWDSQVATTCAGNATYTATYTSTFVEYPVIFKNEDGSVISEKTYHWGDPIVVPADPTKAADNTYTYTFAGWDKTVVNCAGNATYTATYTSTFVEYPVIFKNEDGSVISEKTYHWGDPIVVPANPTKAADNTYTYAFAGWDKTVVNCAGNATYTATYTSTFVEYPVIFKNEDGSVISEKTYHWGDPIVVPANPTKAADNTYTYTFAGWSPVVSAICAGNAVYTATYKATFKDYTVTFKNEDGREISKTTYHWGDPIVVPADPTKAADNTYTYTFAGWSPVVSAICAGNAVYTATYKATFIEYTVTFRYENGTVISTATYHYGDAIVAPKDPESLTAGYAFAGWDKEIGTCDGNITFTAKFERSYVLGDINDDGVVTDMDAVHLLYYTFMPENYPVNQDCDFNGDGVVTDVDAVHLLYYTFMPDRYPLY